MSRIRVFLAWLILAALPLQGFAAASMLFCGVGAGGHSVAATTQPSDSHSAHDHGHHAKAEDGSKQLDAEGASASHADAASHADSGHRCAVCASCCTLAAISEFPGVAQPAAPPSADLPQLSVRVATRAAPVPDKPPRA